MKETMWAECILDEVTGKIVWYCTCEDDRGDTVNHEVVELKADTFPLGTKITISEPLTEE